MAHPLAVYLEAKKLTQEEFARRAGVERSTINKVLTGDRRRFSVEVALKISRATRNAVSFEEALGLPRKEPRTDQAA